MSNGTWNNNNGNNNQQQERPQGKEAAPNKVKFSSVKLGNSKQGSPTIGLYLKPEEMVKLRNLLDELLGMNAEGAKLSCIVIAGEKYDSGYAYVNPKEKRQDNGQGQGQSGYQRGNGGYGQRQNAGHGDRAQAREYLQNKRLGGGTQNGQGN